MAGIERKLLAQAVSHVQAGGIMVAEIENDRVVALPDMVREPLTSRVQFGNRRIAACGQPAKFLLICRESLTKALNCWGLYT